MGRMGWDAPGRKFPKPRVRPGRAFRRMTEPERHLMRQMFAADYNVAFVAEFMGRSLGTIGYHHRTWVLTRRVLQDARRPRIWRPELTAKSLAEYVRAIPKTTPRQWRGAHWWGKNAPGVLHDAYQLARALESLGLDSLRRELVTRHFFPPGAADPAWMGSPTAAWPPFR